jgi:hypothetical protein
MILHLRKSVMFTQDPDARFSKERSVPTGLWKEMWKRYKLLDYTYEDLADYFEIKAKKQITKRSLQRWIKRTEIYSRAQEALLKGAQAVKSDFFGVYELDVMKEILKNGKDYTPKALV